MNDLWKQQLGLLAGPPSDEEVASALRSVAGRSRRRKALTSVGVAAVSTAVVGAAVLAVRNVGSDDQVATGPSDRRGNDESTTTAPAEPAQTMGDPEGDGFPWTTSTTTPGRAPTPEQVSAIEEQLTDADQDLVRSWGMGQRTDGSDVYLIDLRADAVQLAGELWEQWGSVVEINLGFRVYPTGDPSPFALGECPPPVATTRRDTGLRGTLTLADRGEVASGGDLEGTVTVTNTTGQTVFIRSTYLNNVTPPGDVEVQGVSTAVTAAVLEEATAVAAGGTAEVDVVFGTTSCGPDGPPGVAPGTYDAVTVISLVDGDLGETIVGGLLVRAPVTVTAAG